MKDIMRLCFSLGAVCLIGTAALVLVNKITLGPREAAAKATFLEGLKVVLPPETTKIALETKEDAEEKDKVVVMDDVKLYRGYDSNGDELGIACEASAVGFSGPIQTLVGINNDGEILCVLVVGHGETPGLGTRVTDRKAQKSIWGGNEDTDGLPPNPFLDAFTGSKASAPKNVDAISGATQSGNGVKNAVAKACQAYTAYKSAN